MIDPKLHFCRCGCKWKPKLIHKLIMLVFGKYTKKCNQCGASMEFILVHHVVKIKTEEIKNKERIWKNG